MDNRAAVRQLRRLMTWLEAFKECFGHRAQGVALRRYVQGLLSDSARKSMEAMLARVTDPGAYQSFQHFITDAPWSADRVWRRLREQVPERTGVLIIDGTSFPKQGTHSVGVARQYCGALGKVANCQVAVTVALWTGVRAYLLGAALYLPKAWLTDAARTQAKIPAAVRFHERWRQALVLIRQVHASDFTLTGGGGGRRVRRQQPVSRGRAQAGPAVCGGHFVDANRLCRPPAPGPAPRRRAGPPPTPTLPEGVDAVSVATVAADQTSWRTVRWRNRGADREWVVRCTALRVTPAHDWRRRRLAPEVWLLCEQDTGDTPRTKYYFLHAPATTTWRKLVRFAHHRWAIEQQYRELKTDLGFDHFEGAGISYGDNNLQGL